MSALSPAADHVTHQVSHQIEASPGEPAQPPRIISRDLWDPSANCHSSIVDEDHFWTHSVNWNILTHLPGRSINWQSFQRKQCWRKSVLIRLFLQLGLPTARSIVPIWAPKARQLEKRFHRSNSAAPGLIAFNCHKIQDGGRRQFFDIRTPVSLERLKLETLKLVSASSTGCNLDGMQKLDQRERGPSKVA